MVGFFERTVATKWAVYITAGGILVVFGILMLSIAEDERSGMEGFEEVTTEKSGSFTNDNPSRRMIHIYSEDWYSCDQGISSSGKGRLEFTITDSNGTSVVPEDWVCNSSQNNWLVMTVQTNGSEETYTFTSNYLVRIVTADIGAEEVDRIEEIASFNAGIGCYLMCFSIPLFIIGIKKGRRSAAGESVTITSTPVISNQTGSGGYKKTSTGFYMPSPPSKQVDVPASSDAERIMQDDEATSNDAGIAAPWANINELNE